VSNNKNDLTRIEDLGEFIHELNNSEDTLESETSDSDVPDLPSFNEEETSFDSTEEESSFESPEDFGSTFESESTASSDSSFSTDFTESENSSSEEMTNDWNTEAEAEIEDPLPPQEELTSSFDDQPSFNEPEPSQVYIPEPLVEARSEFKTPETFEDLKKFSENSSFSGMATEGNPSFSVLVKNVRFIEDVSDIVLLLKEYNLLVDSEEQTKARLMRGMLLIPRISEYAAIHLAINCAALI